MSCLRPNTSPISVYDLARDIALGLEEEPGAFTVDIDEGADASPDECHPVLERVGQDFIEKKIREALSNGGIAL